MRGSSNNVLINEDEYALLSEMLLDTDPINDKEVKYDISEQSGKDNLLFQLILANDLQLIANYENHHLVFPVQIKRGDFSNFSLSVKPPNIFETGKKLRSWRLPANRKMSIVNQKGEKLPYRIKDLSASGISLSIDKESEQHFPVTLHNTYYNYRIENAYHYLAPKLVKLIIKRWRIHWMNLRVTICLLA